MYEYLATVNEVLDGDTLNLTVDLGFDPVYRRLKRGRLYGINAPEKNTQAGLDAKAYLVARLPVGCKVRIKTIKPPKSEFEKTEKFGGFLVIVYPDIMHDATTPETSLNDEMIAKGHAKAYFGGAR